jgi:hypothetical protein
VGALLEVTNADVAPRAQKTPHVSFVVAMVDMQLGNIAADGAGKVLPLL